MLVQYVAQNKVDKEFIENSLSLMQADASKVHANLVLEILLAYYLLTEEQYNLLFQLLHNTKNPEL